MFVITVLSSVLFTYSSTLESTWTISVSRYSTSHSLLAIHNFRKLNTNNNDLASVSLSLILLLIHTSYHHLLFNCIWSFCIWIDDRLSLNNAVIVTQRRLHTHTHTYTICMCCCVWARAPSTSNNSNMRFVVDDDDDDKRDCLRVFDCKLSIGKTQSNDGDWRNNKSFK